MKIGVVGYSRNDFDHDLARSLLHLALDNLLANHPTSSPVSIVSGLTRTGIPLLAYELAEQRFFRKVAIVPACALSHPAGIYRVDECAISGNAYGDESTAFVNGIDALVRIGGGAQSLEELKMFVERCQRSGIFPVPVVEHELPIIDRS